MNHFFKVMGLDQVMGLVPAFPAMPLEKVPLNGASQRILGWDIVADQDLPGFRRSTMDGYAVHAGATFGASEANPAWLRIAGTIAMGETPSFTLASDEAAPISTGGMLPQGADSVVMVEHTEPIDEATVEIYKSVAPLQHVVDRAEDYRQGQEIITAGTRIRPQESGVLAALGISDIEVFQRPTVAIISTGDEIVPVEETPAPGKIRDMNSHTLAGLVLDAGAIPLQLGIVKDSRDDLFEACSRAVAAADMVLISGGSSVGMRDFTVDVLSDLAHTELLVHGISISPGKPTILARSGRQARVGTARACGFCHGGVQGGGVTFFAQTHGGKRRGPKGALPFPPSSPVMWPRPRAAPILSGWISRKKRGGCMPPRCWENPVLSAPWSWPGGSLKSVKMWKDWKKILWSRCCPCEVCGCYLLWGLFTTLVPFNFPDATYDGRWGINPVI